MTKDRRKAVFFGSFILSSFFIFFCNWADHPAGIACGNHSGWNILCYDTAAANDDIAANGDTWQDLYSAAEPHIVADRDRTGIFQTLIAAFGVNRMSGGIKAAVWSNEHVVSKGHLCTIENDTVMVGKEVFTDFNVIAIVTPERRYDGKCSSGFS